MVKRSLMLMLGFILAFASATYAEVVVGKPAPDFTLSDDLGNTQILSTYQGKYVILEWYNPDCPFVKKHYDSGNMQALQKEMINKDVVWLSIDSSAPGKEGYRTPADMTLLTLQKKASPTAVLIDSDGKVGRMYGAQTTPQMFIIDPKGIVIYQGAIDDKPSTDKADIATSTNYVKAAIEEALAGKPVSNPTTKAYGCSVKY